MDDLVPEYPLGDLSAALDAKINLLESLQQELSESQIKNASNDYHSKKAPYPACGMTVHPANGCSGCCLYCYVPRHRVRVTPLSAKEIAYSLILSPFFFPGQYGTFVAVGSITDPFLPEVADLSFDIIREIQSRFGNPVQVATKQRVPIESLRDLEPHYFSKLCFLVSLSSLKYDKRLEPRVPHPEERLEFVKAIRKEGGSPFVFLRPIIPGITDWDVEDLLSAIKESLTSGVVLGSLRLNQAALARLDSVIDTTEIVRRLSAPRLGKGFRYIYTQDLKQMFSHKARLLGIQPFHSACCANAVSHNLPCVNACWTNSRFCTHCWNQCSKKPLPPIPDPSDVQQFIERWLGKQSLVTIDFENRTVHLSVKASPAVRIGIKRVLETLLRARTVVAPQKG